MGKFVDLTGHKYGRFTVVRRSGVSTSGRIMWDVRCDCGAMLRCTGNNMRTGNAKSCGCLQKEKVSLLKGRHRETRTKLHNTWQGILSRCHNPNSLDYPTYGAAGVEVCPEWRESYERFRDDMGQPPTPKHSIDRVNNQLGYSKDNCRWATATEQANNKRNNHIITHNGVTLSMADWARRVNMTRGTIKQRLARGMSVEEALTRPVCAPGQSTNCAMGWQSMRSWRSASGQRSPCTSSGIRKEDQGGQYERCRRYLLRYLRTYFRRSGNHTSRRASQTYSEMRTVSLIGGNL